MALWQVATTTPRHAFCRDGSRIDDMMAGSHVLVGLVAWGWAAPRLGLGGPHPAGLALAAVGALLPDLDHPRSWVGRRLRIVSRPLAALFGHRGFTHSLLAILLLLWVLSSQGIARGVAVPLAVGYLSHLAADLLTPAGLRLGWPLRRTFAVPLCKTGSFREVLLVATLLGWTLLHLIRA